MPDLGPHLLGRHPNTPDDRDWSPDKLHQHLGIDHKPKPVPVPQDATLDKTIRQAVADRDPFVTTWKGLLALWKWIKSVLFPPKPTPPAPTPTPTPQPTPTPPPAPTPTPTPPSGDGPLWGSIVVLDQGNFGTCVGNAWEGRVYSAPTESDARALYYEATCIGGACDSTYQNGSTTRDGAKAVQARKKLVAYAFAQSMAEIEEWLDHHGPVVIGINWSGTNGDGMFTPDPDGTVHYNPNDIAGGHEVFIRKNWRSLGKKQCRNSWGYGWGVHGDFFLTDADLQQLLNDGGDACLCEIV